MTLLDVQHVKKIYKTRFQGNQVEALKDIHFTVEKGDYVAIMGESGSGKSTLLNILAMLDKPTEGRVFLNGTDTATIKNNQASSFRREKLGFVFQDFLLLDGLTVRENILLPSIIGGTVSSQTENRADQLLDVFGLAHITDKYPAEISGGEKQRTAVARALINQPKMILADEPTGNLDSKSSRAVIDSFMQAKDALEATILMVTHDSYAASFCDRVVILRDGVVWKVLTRGTTDRIHFQDALLEAIGAMGKE